MHGARSDTSVLLSRYLRSDQVAPAATLAEPAGLLLGALAAVHEIDDVHQDTSMHPGSVVVAASLAALTESSASGARVLFAIAAGYEMAIRLSIAAGHRHYHFFHATATCGTVGAAVAASIILGLDPEQTAHAIGFAATAASGLWEDINDNAVGIKHLHSGLAAERGVRAAKLARLGLQAAARSIEGTKGFLAALAQPGPHAPGEGTLADEAIENILLDGLGERWAILRNIFKRYPFCLGCFEPLEGIRHILSVSAKGANDVDSVVIDLYPPTATMVAQPNPLDQYQAKFSAPFALALVLTGRDPECVPLPAAWLAEPDVRRWYPLIRVQGNAAFPPRKAQVTVVWRDGSHASATQPFRGLEEAKVWARFVAASWQYLGACGPVLVQHIAECAALPDAAAIMPFVHRAVAT